MILNELNQKNDLSIAVTLDLKTNLISDDNMDRPLSYHNRTCHILPNENNPLIPQLQNIEQLCQENQMKINGDKTSIMLFNRSKTYDFQPQLFLGDKSLEVVETAKILGIVLSSDLKWKGHVSYITAKARKKLCMIRRVRELGGSISDMLTVFELQIRVLTEMACPAWNGALTGDNVHELESIQKAAVAIILNYNFKSYKKALQKL